MPEKEKTNAEVVEDLVTKQGPKDGTAVATTKKTKDSPNVAGVDDPVRDILGNLVDVNNDELEGTHVIDGDLLLANTGQLTEPDAADLRGLFEPVKKEEKKASAPAAEKTVEKPVVKSAEKAPESKPKSDSTTFSPSAAVEAVRDKLSK